jgi:TolA-binding protein
MRIAAPAMLALALAIPAQAQDRAEANSRQVVTSTDIQRLQDRVYDAGNEVARLRSRDQATADRLQSQLDDLRDEVVYLRVKLRKDGAVNRDEYNDVRSRLESVRSETRAAANPGYDARQPTDARQGNSTWSNGGAGGNNDVYEGRPAGTTGEVRQSRRNEVPAGTELDVRLERALNSGTNQVEDRFTATTMADLYQGNEVLIPAGSTLRGVVSSVTRASRTERKGAMTVAFDQINVNGRAYPIHGTVTQALESEGIRGEAGKIGAGAGVGAIIGGILGGAKGALLGILIGGGGTIAATEGKDVDLPAGTILRVRMEQPLLVR